ncbi:hypothetical protein L0337_00885 [candidate division KSB1 bacterium]|nr:hypothetical protein [candidate division KSB1 bacterium]
MKKHFKVAGTAAALLALAIIGCSKNDKSPTQPQNTTPLLPSIAFIGPNTGSQDPNAQQAKLHIQTINGYTNILAPFAGLQGTPNGNSWTWTYNVQNLTATLTATQQSDGSYYWKLVLNGTDPNTNTTYNNWAALDGTTSADGKNGSFKGYSPNTTTLLAQFAWATSSNGVLTGTFKLYDNTGAVTSQIDIGNNSDGSGEVRLSTGGTLSFRAVWLANGSGQWWRYDANGNQIATGSWT